MIPNILRHRLAGCLAMPDDDACFIDVDGQPAFLQVTPLFSLRRYGLGQQPVDLAPQAFIFRTGHARVRSGHLAIASDQVFVKIPARHLSGGFGQLAIKR